MSEHKPIRSFKDLECWKTGRRIRQFAFTVTRKFPSEERYGLTNNLMRAARSITNNIAEGYGRFHFKENTQFCRISRGSAYELIDHLITAFDEGYIDELQLKEGRLLIDEFLKIINGYINYLNQQSSKVSEDIATYKNLSIGLIEDLITGEDNERYSTKQHY